MIPLLMISANPSFAVVHLVCVTTLFRGKKRKWTLKTWVRSTLSLSLSPSGLLAVTKCLSVVGCLCASLPAVFLSLTKDWIFLQLHWYCGVAVAAFYLDTSSFKFSVYTQLHPYTVPLCMLASMGKTPVMQCERPVGDNQFRRKHAYCPTDCK